MDCVLQYIWNEGNSKIWNKGNIENCIRNFHLQEECIRKLMKNVSTELITVVVPFVIWLYMYTYLMTLIIN